MKIKTISLTKLLSFSITFLFFFSCETETTELEPTELSMFHADIEGIYSGSYEDVTSLKLEFKGIKGSLYLVNYSVEYKYEDHEGKEQMEDGAGSEKEKGEDGIIVKVNLDEENKNGLLSYDFEENGKKVVIDGEIREESDGSLVVKIKDFTYTSGVLEGTTIGVKESLFELKKEESEEES